ncbi:MAG TPA: M28 family peptidase [Candidatus Acidoferrales bacterium]|nr:M28 family peptidase [Candidatus Acidoferrales bacterium]
MIPLRKTLLAAALAGAALLPAACGHASSPSNATVAASPASSPAPAQPPAIAPSDEAPPASQTGGFDGAAAYDYTAKLVAFGPRPPASDAIHRTQDYIVGQLKGFGCAVDTDDFHAQTPIGTLPMKNIIAKVPGAGQGIILLLTHYDTLRLDNFVGADDGGSSSGLMLEMARLLCAGPKRKYAVWIAFLDGEEAQVVTNGVAQWTDADSVYGSRELAARLDLSGDLKHLRAVILADMIGQKNLHILRESDSTKWLTNLVWSTADRLGYSSIFLPSETQISDDHQPFLKRNVPAVDIIDFDDYSNAGYWHTAQDTMDKLSPRSFSIVGYVILESVAELQK